MKNREHDSSKTDSGEVDNAATDRTEDELAHDEASSTGDVDNAAGDSTATAGDEFSDRIARLEEELQQERGQKLRLAADIDNLRKRMQREREEYQRFATLGLMEDLLTAVDNFQIGLTAADQHPEAKAVADGFRMAYQQLRQILEQHGLKEIYPAGEVFDPNLHDCVAHQANDDVPADHVIAVVRSGYSLRDRMIRPAAVIVSSGPASSATDQGAS